MLRAQMSNWIFLALFVTSHILAFRISPNRTPSRVPSTSIFIESPSLQDLFADKKVAFLGTSDSSDLDTTSPLIFKEAINDNDNDNVFEVPLMPFPNALFPLSREFLYIYEMKFRTLMNDAETNGGILGRCFVSEDGAVGKVGCTCQIIEERRLKDGRSFFIIEAVNRFRIKRITKRTPYLTAEVQLIDDEPVVLERDIAINEALCGEVYSLLKAYLRVAKFRAHRRPTHDYDDEVMTLNNNSMGQNQKDGEIMSTSLNEKYDGLDEIKFGSSAMSRRNASDLGPVPVPMLDNEMNYDDIDNIELVWNEEEEEEEDMDVDMDMHLSPMVMRWRPAAASLGEAAVDGDNGFERHKQFSFAVAHFLSTEPGLMQVLLQERSTSFRLHSLKRILLEAVGELSQKMLETNIVSQRLFDSIVEQSRDPYDDDSDLIPESGYQGMTLQTELSEELVAQLGLSIGDRLVAAKINPKVIAEGFTDKEDGNEEGEGKGDENADIMRGKSIDQNNMVRSDGALCPDEVDTDNFDDDIWSGNSASAFQ